MSLGIASTCDIPLKNKVGIRNSFPQKQIIRIPCISDYKEIIYVLAIPDNISIAFR